VNPLVSVSVVSHGQGELAGQLVEDIDRNCATPVELILTENIPGAPGPKHSSVYPTQHLANEKPKGFGANHNAAFGHCRAPFFCVLNPDVRMRRDPFPELTSVLSDAGVGVAGPLIRNPAGGVEDSARRFPTLASLAAKLLSRGQRGPDYRTDDGPMKVDWIAGMCMLFRSETFRALGGFDERYFLYYEDVDLCRRAARRGLAVVYDPGAELIHDARRASRRNPRLALHHARSIARYLFSKG
jgi:GT2 family glycosyltransferase